MNREISVTAENTLISEFKKSLKERVKNEYLSFMYEKLFFSFFISEKELNELLEYYITIFKKEPNDWFRQFHKSIRQTDFFQGTYIKLVDTLTDEERKRRNEIFSLRAIHRRRNTDEEATYTQELKNLNSLINTQLEVSVASIADSFLYSLIHLDAQNELKNAMEITFKIYS